MKPLLIVKLVIVTVRHLIVLYLLHTTGLCPPYGLTALFLGSLMWRNFACTAGGHRYFCHQSFETTVFFERALAFTIAATDPGMLQYFANIHMAHHLHSDTEHDIHSPSISGFWWVQFGIYHIDKTKMLDPSNLRTKFRRDLS